MTGNDPSDVERSRADDYRAHAEDRVPTSPGGIGAAAIHSGFQNEGHIWECVVTDGGEWHYIRVVGSDLGPFPDLSAEDVEEGIERFAATLPSQYRMRQLLNANPLHIDRQGNVTD